MSLKSLMACDRKSAGVTPRDGLIGAAVMLGLVPVFKAFAPDLAFIAPFTLSMPFWLMKGQSWKTQAAIVGGTFAVLVLIR